MEETEKVRINYSTSDFDLIKRYFSKYIDCTAQY